jgi:hypothetical protein
MESPERKNVAAKRIVRSMRLLRPVVHIYFGRLAKIILTW